MFTDDNRCGCACGGVSALSLWRATRPRTRPSVRTYRPSPELGTLVLPPGGLDGELLERLRAEVLELIRAPDDDIVLKGGCGPEEVRRRGDPNKRPSPHPGAT